MQRERGNERVRVYEKQTLKRKKICTEEFCATLPSYVHKEKFDAKEEEWMDNWSMIFEAC